MKISTLAICALSMTLALTTVSADQRGGNDAMKLRKAQFEAIVEGKASAGVIWSFDGYISEELGKYQELYDQANKADPDKKRTKQLEQIVVWYEAQSKIMNKLSAIALELSNLTGKKDEVSRNSRQQLRSDYAELVTKLDNLRRNRPRLR